MAADIGVIWVRVEQKYFCKWDWTTQISLTRLNKFAVVRNSAGQTRTPFGRWKHRPQRAASNARIVAGYGMTASGAKLTFAKIRRRLSAMCGRLRVGKNFLHVSSIGRCSHLFGL